MRADPGTELLVDIVSVGSPTGRTDALRDLLIERAGPLGLTGTVDGAGNVILETGEGPTRILLLCHMDTVPGELPVRVEGGTLHGRGSVDAKGCLAMAIGVASSLSGTRGGRLTVVAVPDEEGPSLGVRELVRGPRPDYVIVGEPSGWQGITIGYKGAMRLGYSGSSPKRHSGAARQNSAEAAIDFWNALEAFCRSESAAVPEGAEFGRLSPTLLSIASGDDGLTMTTVMDIDVRVPPGYDTSRLEAEVERTRAGASVVVTGREPPVLAPKNNALVRAMVRAIRAHGGQPTFKKKTGTSDMNVAAQAWDGVPIIAYGPGDSSLDHTPEERLDLEEYRIATSVLLDAIKGMLEGG